MPTNDHMGSSCSITNSEDHAEKEEGPVEHLVPNTSVRKYSHQHQHQPYTSRADTRGSNKSSSSRTKELGDTMDYNTVDALDRIVDDRLKRQKSDTEAYDRTDELEKLSRGFPRIQASLEKSTADGGAIDSKEVEVLFSKYEQARAGTQNREGVLGFSWQLEQIASSRETRVNDIIQRLRVIDRKRTFRGARIGYSGQRHPRFPGDHFLYNRELIDQSELFRLARLLPKGAHLHIHFNACLEPHVLIDIAKEMDRMFITSDCPLTEGDDWLAYRRCEIQFNITAVGKESHGNLFDQDYKSRQMMRFRDFIEEFPKHYTKCTVDKWLIEKLVFHEEEAHGWLQTVDGAWEKFNGRTRMMKGLFNYERAYREYTRACLHDFVNDNIQYAEIRPNFMPTNQLWTDDGEKQIDNEGIMRIIKEEFEAFQNENRGYFGGLKVIYCTPRSFSNEQVLNSLKECLGFKQNPEFSSLIAGYDLVGEESKGKPLKTFVKEFLWFQQECRRRNVDIPFLFHCGETLDIGSDTDGNLVDALLLNSKRIGHGFALARHPYIMEKMKKQGVCLELCPISNEILGLTPRVNGHAMYNLLANDVHCTVNSDNGTLFNSTLSHDFYQVLIGKSDMTLWGWKQLIQWSLQHSCMTAKELESVTLMWEDLWEEFLKEAVRLYSEDRLQELEKESEAI